MAHESIAAEYVPVEYRLKGDSLSVRWLKCSGELAPSPFFNTSLRKVVEQALDNHFIETDVASLEVIGDSSRCVPPAGFIFHVSRCGSTLIANMLNAVPRTVVLAEPPLPMGLAFVSGASASIRGQACEPRLLRSSILALARDTEEFDRSFVKFFSCYVLEVDAVRQALPHVIEVFLYRHPLEVLVANLRDVPPPWMWLERLTGVGREDALRRSPIELCARAIGTKFRAMREARRRATVLMNYSTFDERLPETLLRIFGISGSCEVIDRMREIQRYHSKRGSIRFKPDGDAKLRQAVPEMYEAIQMFAIEDYNALELMRLSEDCAAL